MTTRNEVLRRYVWECHEQPGSLYYRHVDVNRCRKQVADFSGFHFFQCSRNPTQTIDGFGFCTQHYKTVMRALKGATDAD